MVQSVILRQLTECSNISINLTLFVTVKLSHEYLNISLLVQSNEFVCFLIHFIWVGRFCFPIKNTVFHTLVRLVVIQRRSPDVLHIHKGTSFIVVLSSAEYR